MAKLITPIKLFLPVLACLLTYLNACQATESLDTEELSDWIPLSACESVCKGHYLYSPDPFPKAEALWATPIEISANETEYQLKGNSTLHGDVVFKQGSRTLYANDITLERVPNTQEWKHIWAKGAIQFTSPGMKLWGRDAEYYPLSRHFYLRDTSYRLYSRHARGHAQSVEMDEENNLHLKEANYTTCAPLQNTWGLKAKSLSLYPNQGRAVAKHVQLNLKEVPVFYLPYFNYPIDKKRHSGFLFPSYGSTSNSGYEFIVPYYWNIAPNYDLSLAARWLSERGMEGQAKLRYLLTHGEGVIQWNILPNDRKYAHFKQENQPYTDPLTGSNVTLSGLSQFDPRILALNTTDTRQAFNYRHTSQWGHKWQFNVIFDYVNDSNYFVDLGNDIQTASTVDLPQKVNLTYYGDNWAHLFNVEEYQVLQPLSTPVNAEIYKRQPQWVFQALYPAIWSNLTMGLNGEVVNFNRLKDPQTQLPVTEGQRLHLRPSLSFPLTESWFFFIPRIQIDWLHYYLRVGEESSLQDFSSSSGRTIPMYDLDTGLIFDRNLSYKNLSFTQTLEPRIYYLYVPYKNQNAFPDFDSGVINFSYSQLFRDNRFSGRDRVGDANQMSLSLTSRLVPTNGQELFRASIGQILYFSPRLVTLCEDYGTASNCYPVDDVSANSPTTDRSDFIAQGELHFNPIWSGGFFWQGQVVHPETEQAAFNLQYHPSLQKIININYYWLKNDIAQTDPTTGITGSLHQTDISVFWPLDLHWQLLSRWHYDLIQNQTIELLGGLEYNACCIAVQVVGSRYRQSTNFFYPDQYATGVFAQVVFKGLSAIGLNNPDGKLKQKIPGYVPLYDRQQWLTSSRKAFFPPGEVPLY